MPHELERRYLFNRHEIRMEPTDDESPGTIEGYAAVFYRDNDPKTEFELWEGRIMERIDPAAFADLARDDVRCLFDHDSAKILGRSAANTLELDVDSVGLHYRCTLPNTTAGRDVAESIRRGDISGSSFQFDVLEQEWTERDGEPTIRTLKKLKLYDVGPVTFPAYEATTTGVRSDRAAAELEQVVAARQAAARRQRRRRILCAAQRPRH